MDGFFFVVWTGFIAGVSHVYVGADHLAALMPLSVGRQGKALWLGVRWGVGHSVGVLLVAALLLFTKTWLDLVIISVWGERFVGFMLIALGVFGIRAAYADKIHLHPHKHAGETHAHLHLHGKDDSYAGHAGQAHIHKHAALGAGALHGVAGMAHLMGVLPSLALPSVTQSLLYLAAFALGSIIAMACFSAAFGTLTTSLGKSAPRLLGASLYFAAVTCLLVGAAWLIGPLLGYELP